MSAKSILEADGKAILNYHLTRAPVIKPSPLPSPTTHNPPPRLAVLNFPEDADVQGVLNQAEVTYPWLLQPDARFVAKPDMLCVCPRSFETRQAALSGVRPALQAAGPRRSREARRGSVLTLVDNADSHPGSSAGERAVSWLSTRRGPRPRPGSLSAPARSSRLSTSLVSSATSWVCLHTPQRRERTMANKSQLSLS